jgi:hypothetical protein
LLFKATKILVLKSYHLFSQEGANGGAAKQQLFHLPTTGALSLRQKPV